MHKKLQKTAQHCVSNLFSRGNRFTNVTVPHMNQQRQIQAIWLSSSGKAIFHSSCARSTNVLQLGGVFSPQEPELQNGLWLVWEGVTTVLEKLKTPSALLATSLSTETCKITSVSVHAQMLIITRIISEISEKNKSASCRERVNNVEQISAER